MPHVAQIAHSYLFVPGNRPERFAKACASGAGAVIVDLEDAVAPADKPAARAAVATALSAAQPMLVRINSAGTEWFRDDVEMCRADGVAGIVLPKAESVEDIGYVSARVGADKAILPLIETAQGIWNAHALTRCAQVQRLLFGSIDLQSDLGIGGEGEELLYFRSQLVLVSRLAGIAPPVDGVTTAIDDVQRLRDDALRARKLGFGGKLCIHPNQVGTVNVCFRPGEEEVRWAARVVEAAAASGGAAVAVDGKMVDKPVLLRAQAMLAQASEA
ncbi:MAG: HpcH/HpaI aldolase/citrate lyase family protein [Noviherbaspirillum sp.]